MMQTSFKTNSDRAREGEQGWALLGLLLALGILAMVLSSLAVPNIKFKVQRDKEAEMLYRGQQMAEGIARHYNNGQLGQLRLQPPVYGFLTDLKKLRDGINVGLKEIKLVRLSAMIDPMTSQEWEPVRAGDPRINKVLQAFFAKTGIRPPESYERLAGVSTRFIRAPGTELPSTDPATPPVTPPVTPPTQVPPGVGSRGGQALIDPNDPNDPFDDDDDDPLAPLRQLGQGNLPIVGVAPRLKGESVRTLYGLNKYEEWVFIYIPPNPQRPFIPTPPPPGGGQGRGSGGTSPPPPSGGKPLR